MTDWQTLPPGPLLRWKIARSAGWHMRKIPVNTGDIACDFFIYDNDDRLAYHRAITFEELQDEEAVIAATWIAAMNDDDTPRWDEDMDEALWLIDRSPYEIHPADTGYRVWVGAEQYTGHGETKPLALMRAWIAWAQEHLHYGT